MFGLSDQEKKFLINNANNLGYEPNIKKAFDLKNLREVQTNIHIYLTDDDSMYYDSDGQNWYTEKGK